MPHPQEDAVWLRMWGGELQGSTGVPGGGEAAALELLRGATFEPCGGAEDSACCRDQPTTPAVKLLCVFLEDWRSCLRRAQLAVGSCLVYLKSAGNQCSLVLSCSEFIYELLFIRICAVTEVAQVQLCPV